MEVRNTWMTCNYGQFNITVDRIFMYKLITIDFLSLRISVPFVDLYLVVGKSVTVRNFHKSLTINVVEHIIESQLLIIFAKPITNNTQLHRSIV